MTTLAKLTTDNAVLVLIDFQERLFPVMHDGEKLLRNVVKLIQGAKALEIPVLITEQYPRGLGPTLPEIKELLPDITPIEKISFNCCDEEKFNVALAPLHRKQVLVAGIEAHICVYQTAVALSGAGYEVQIIVDAISSRDPENKQVTMFKLGNGGINLTTVEMALFELLKTGSGDVFKQISKIVR